MFCKHAVFPCVVVSLTFLSVGCGSGLNRASSGNFSAQAVTASNVATLTSSTIAQLASIAVSPTNVVGGSPLAITVTLTAPAPSGGAVVELGSSNPTLVRTPASVTIPAGTNSAKVSVTTATVSAPTPVSVAAIYNDLVKGTSVTVSAGTTPTFSVVLQPWTLTIADGSSGAASVFTKLTTGYNHALQLKLSEVPSGISATLSPTFIPAPGSGTSKLAFTVGSSVPSGTHSMLVTATDGTTFRYARLTLNVGASAGANFQGCWYQQNGHRYQGVRISVDNPGTYPFDAVLYHGSTCNTNDFADEFGFGTPINFGGFGFIFWFSDFADQTDTSAIWHVGSNHSQCVNYAIAPSC